MKPGTTRVILIAVFLITMVAAISISFLAFAKDTITGSDLVVLLGTILATWGVQLSVILGGVFGSPKTAGERVSSVAGPVAVVLSILWNALLLGRLVLFAMAVLDPQREDVVDDVVTYLQTVAAASSFLVAGALAFFFTRTAAE